MLIITCCSQMGYNDGRKHNNWRPLLASPTISDTIAKIYAIMTSLAVPLT